MKWAAQVRHVMAKDVRQARWLLSGYLGLVVIAWARALAWPDTPRVVFDISMVLVVLAGILVAGTVVQADSPTRSDAFWGSRPLHPGAVLTAKTLLAVLMLVAVPVLAQLHALVASGVQGGSLLGMLARSVWMVALWLLIAMVLAAVTQDIRSFIVALVILPAGLGLLTFSASFGMARRARWSGSVMETIGPAALVVVGVGAAVGVLVVLYRTRTLRRTVKVVAAVGVACMFLTIIGSPARRRSEPQLAAISDDSGVTVAADYTRSILPQLNVHIPDSRKSDRLVVLDSSVAVLRLRDGTITTVPLRGAHLQLESSRLPIDPRIRWRGAIPGEGRGGGFGVPLTREQREVLRVGIASASIEGSAFVAEPRVALTLPFQVGASVRRDGKGVRIMTISPLTEDSLAVVMQSTITRSGPPNLNQLYPFSPWDTPRYVLVNEARGEAVVLQGGYGGSSEALVLPGAWRWSGPTQLRLEPAGLVALSADWYSAAKLVVIDWVIVGRAPFHSAATVR
jgi:hypothetical protein